MSCGIWEFEVERIKWQGFVMIGKIRIDGNWFLGYFINNDFIESTDAINKI